MYFVARKTNQVLQSLNWDGMLLNKHLGDESKAFDEFFALLDKFRKIKPIEITEFGIEAFQDNLREKVEFKIYLVDYGRELGCTVYYQKNEDLIKDYFETQEDAMQMLKSKYGDTLRSHAIHARDHSALINNMDSKYY